jgi:hypothetical protein
VSFMGEKAGRQRRRFQAHETERISTLDGALLATFAQRVLGFGVDVLIAVIIWAPRQRKDAGKMGGADQGGVVDPGADGFVAVGGASAWLWRGGA